MVQKASAPQDCLPNHFLRSRDDIATSNLAFNEPLLFVVKNGWSVAF